MLLFISKIRNFKNETCPQILINQLNNSLRQCSLLTIMLQPEWSQRGIFRNRENIIFDPTYRFIENVPLLFHAK